MSKVDDFFDPTSKEFIHNPHPYLDKLLSDFPIAWFEKWQCWLISGNKRIAGCLLDRRLSTDFNLWEYAPPKKMDKEKTHFEKLMDNNLFFLSRQDHLRLRKLALPAFSPRVMDFMKKKFAKLVKQRLEEIGEVQKFDFSKEVAEIIPSQAIASLVGVPEEYFDIFDNLAYGIVRGINPMLDDEERGEATSGIEEGLNMLNDLIEERRKLPGEDFLSALILAEEEGDRLNNWEMCALIGSVLSACSDTAVDLHSYLIKALLEHPEQLDLVLKDRNLIQNAISEVLRHQSSGKTGLARYATENIVLEGNKIKKHQMIQLITSTAGRDPEAFEDPEKFNILRNQENNISFGQGPHYCIGVTLVRSQVEVMFNEVFSRFPSLELTDDIAYDYFHHNARRMNKFILKTNF